MSNNVVNIDNISLIIDVLGFASAILIFIATSRQDRKAVEEQTRRESVRATLTDFAELRRTHASFQNDIKEEGISDAKRNMLIKDYLTDLERFATGCNLGGYDLDVVNIMSGGLLVRQYRQYFKPYIENSRNSLRLDSFLKASDLYCEVEKMLKQLHELRGEVWTEPEHLKNEQRVLEAFLNMPVESPEKIFDLFGKLPNAKVQHGDGTEGFVYVPGKREDRCLLVAHADTVFDYRYINEKKDSLVSFDGINYVSQKPGVGIGADDRAGCAILWLLRDSGHSLLVLDGEEHGQVGANYLKSEYPDIYSELNEHTFIIELDRRGNKVYKTYNIPVTESFRMFIEKETSHELIEGFGRTDICVLCDKICGANLSVGYYNEHKETEYLCYDEWEAAYFTVKKMIDKPLEQFRVN